MSGWPGLKPLRPMSRAASLLAQRPFLDRLLSHGAKLVFGYRVAGKGSRSVAGMISNSGKINELLQAANQAHIANELFDIVLYFLQYPFKAIH